MSRTKYLRIYLNRQEAEVVSIDEVDLSIDYKLEEAGDFQTKKAARTYDIELPATQTNDRIFGSFYNDAIQDMTPNESLRNTMQCYIEAGGGVVISGQALLKSGTRGHLPKKYVFSCYGGNGDWSILLKDLTLASCVNPATHVFNSGQVQESWNYTGAVEGKDFVYAPVRYRQAFADNDVNVKLLQLRPSVFVYWMIIRAFRTIGYRVKSDFFATEYFKRMVMPWVWGDFLKLESKDAELLKFKAVGSNEDRWMRDFSGTGSTTWGYNPIMPGNQITVSIGDFRIANTATNGGYNNGAQYQWDQANYRMVWTYPVGSGLGTITANFSLNSIAQVDVSYNSNARVVARCYKNSVQIAEQEICSATAPYVGGASAGGATTGNSVVWNLSVPNIVPGDVVEFRYFVRVFKSTLGAATVRVWSSYYYAGLTKYTSLELLSIAIQPGSVVDLKAYPKFKNYKFLDLLRGIIDYFDLIPSTDNFNRVVYFEPSFPYSLTSNMAPVNQGHFNDKALDWRDKQDLSEDIDLPLFSDMEREFIQKAKDDGSDGGMNKYIGRVQVDPGSSKYLFPNRFQQGKKVLENRFFAPCMHIAHRPWRNLGLGAGVDKIPQIPVIIPENVSNTSEDVSETAFQPRLLYYKGNQFYTDIGVWMFEGDRRALFPFMFAVNYAQNAPNDPALTYCDQKTPAGITIGLTKRFFAQRLAMYRNGQMQQKSFRLSINDVQNWRHREAIILNHNNANAKWLLFEINGFQPLRDESTKVTLWKQSGLNAKTDLLSHFPSSNSVTNQPATVADPDIPYKELLLFQTDLPA